MNTNLYLNYSYSDSFVKNLILIESIKTKINCLDLNYDLKTSLGHKNLINTIFYISQLIRSTDTSLKDAEKIVTSQQVLTESSVDLMVLNNVKTVHNFINSESSSNFGEFEHSIYTELNKLLIHPWKERWDAKYRSFNERFDETLDVLAALRDTNISGSDLEFIVGDLVDWYNLNIHNVSVVVRSGIVLFNLINIGPFIAANTLTTFSIVQFVLSRNNMGNKVFQSIPKLLAQNVDDLMQTFYLSKKSQDLNLFLEWYVGLVAADLKSILENIQTELANSEKSSKQPFLDLNNRQLKVLKYLQNVATIKRDEYCNIMEVSSMTAYRDLEDLRRKKLIKVEGQGRGTKYRLANY